MSLNLENYASKSEYPVIDGGDYEVVLRIERKITSDGTKDFASCDFLIRNDKEAIESNSLNAKFKGAHVFDRCWRDKNNIEWFDLKKLGSILVTQKNKESYQTSFDDIDECLQYLNGITLVITVEKKFDDYFQKEVNSVKYLSYKASKLGKYVAPEAEKVTPTAPAPETVMPVDDNDLPF